MLGNIGFFTYLIASVSYAVLAGLLLVQWRVKPLGPILVFACTATSAWAATIALGTLAQYPPISLMKATELVRDAAWLFFLLQLLSIQVGGSEKTLQGFKWQRLFWPIFLLVLFLLLPELHKTTHLRIFENYALALTIWLGLALLGLLLIEQLYRNATEAERWSLKYLCLGLGTLFAFDILMYSEALLFRELDPELWQARGLINAVAAPWLAVAMARNNSWRVNLHVSRQVVFHTVTLMGTGVYLLVMAGIGYIISFMGGTWGGVLQVGFLAAAIALLFSLLFSGKFRAFLRVELNKHFFSYHYDYREEWLKFTRALSSLNQDVPEGIIRTMADLAQSPAGLLWGGSEGRDLRLMANWQMPPPPGSESGLGTVPAWLQRTEWIIDLQEWRRTPQIYGNLELPAWLAADEQLWLVIPLLFRDRVEGVLMLKRSSLKDRINWEDRDLLKTSMRQAASHLAQHLASQALVEARQFDAFNRLSAYVVHDLKNILAQQSLIVSNAAKHRDNPEFIDDMIGTVANSVARMQRLMEQMRTGIRTGGAESVQMAPLLEKVIIARKDHLPVPLAAFEAGNCEVEADSERLATVFNHLLQNAQEATDPQGSVIVRLRKVGDQVHVDIEDTGRGMDEDFIRERLFRPFESTKGLTGMGIGAFESREYIRHIGGDIRVRSKPGQGSIFHVSLPAAGPSAERSDATDRERIHAG